MLERHVFHFADFLVLARFAPSKQVPTMIRGHRVQPCSERARFVVLGKFLPHFDENIHGGVFGVLTSGHGSAAETANRRRVLAIKFAPPFRVSGLGWRDALLDGGLFRGAHPLGMSPRIHQVIRGSEVKYFMAETCRAGGASDSKSG